MSHCHIQTTFVGMSKNSSGTVSMKQTAYSATKDESDVMWCRDQVASGSAICRCTNHQFQGAIMT